MMTRWSAPCCCEPPIVTWSLSGRHGVVVGHTGSMWHGCATAPYVDTFPGTELDPAWNMWATNQWIVGGGTVKPIRPSSGQTFVGRCATLRRVESGAITGDWRVKNYRMSVRMLDTDPNFFVYSGGMQLGDGADPDQPFAMFTLTRDVNATPFGEPECLLSVRLPGNVIGFEERINDPPSYIVGGWNKIEMRIDRVGVSDVYEVRFYLNSVKVGSTASQTIDYWVAPGVRSWEHRMFAYGGVTANATTEYDDFTVSYEDATDD